MRSLSEADEKFIAEVEETLAASKRVWECVQGKADLDTTKEDDEEVMKKIQDWGESWLERLVEIVKSCRS